MRECDFVSVEILHCLMYTSSCDEKLANQETKKNSKFVFKQIHCL